VARRLVISTGDPAGIGPEVTVKALAQAEVRGLADFIVVGDPNLLRQTAARLDLPAPERIEPAGDATGVQPGQLSAQAGRAAVAAIEHAVAMVGAGDADALVTAPINKEAMRLAGYRWPGHTELLADLCHVAEVRMMLVNDKLRVAHVTTHRSLRSAIDAATRERVLLTIEMTHEGVRRLGVTQARIAVCGVNPHAGENGLFGDEELREVAPAIADARGRGIDASGPWAADTVFWRAAAGEFDAVVAMYHDQGHVAVKVSGFDDGVNVTLGLPFLRTSVDHGTAFDIAGRGIARWQSMAAAIRAAASYEQR
jgi:4-phospho-D-threonate 3-dehydrogenase / 4-phospho-D-erythronate 3-dehydrogenase